MIKYRGLVEKQIGDKKVFFKFNMAAFEMLGDLQDMGASEIIRSGGRAKLSTLSAFLFSGAKQYCKEKSIDPKYQDPGYTRDDATEWIGELGLKTVMEMFTACFEAPKYEVKNDKATLKETGTFQTQSLTQSESVA